MFVCISSGVVGSTAFPSTLLRSDRIAFQTPRVGRLLLATLIVSFSLSLPAHFQPDPVTADCNQVFYSTQRRSGTFSSPNFPAPYPSDVTCRYSFHGRENERVQIIVTELDLRHDGSSSSLTESNECENVDSLTATVTIAGLLRDIGVYCGNKRPPMLMSSGSSLDVTLLSRNAMTSARGFKANYSFVTDFGIKTGEQERSMSCVFSFRSENVTNGTFTSPNFPGWYPRNTECHYLFFGKESEHIYIKFPYFDVDGVAPRCKEDTQSDFVEFSNFNVQLMDRKMQRFCGSKDDNVDRSVSSDGSFFRVTFKSNDLFDAFGFEAFYQFRQIEDPYAAGRRSSRPPNTDGSGSQGLIQTTRHLLFFIAINVVIPQFIIIN